MRVIIITVRYKDNGNFFGLCLISIYLGVHERLFWDGHLKAVMSYVYNEYSSSSTTGAGNTSGPMIINIFRKNMSLRTYK